MNRRTFLAGSVSVGATAALAGCTAISSLLSDDPLSGVDPDPDQLPAPTLGSGDVSLEVYEDFACPHCHTFEAEVFPVLEAELIEPDAVTYAHVDYPIPVDDRSVPMANAARAVQDDTRTDDDPAGAFFEYKRAVYGSEEESDENLAGLAEEVGADPDAVETALEEETYYPTLAADRRRGKDGGVEGTPTVHLEEEEFVVEDVEDVEALIAAAESRAGGD